MEISTQLDAHACDMHIGVGLGKTKSILHSILLRLLGFSQSPEEGRSRQVKSRVAEGQV